jgi:4-oxalocrotonate tautomerase
METPMPHVIVKMYSGRSEQLKARLAEAVTKAVTSTLNLDEDSVSVALEDVQPKDWTEQVFKPDIVGRPAMIYKKPGYNPL